MVEKKKRGEGEARKIAECSSCHGDTRRLLPRSPAPILWRSFKKRHCTLRCLPVGLRITTYVSTLLTRLYLPSPTVTYHAHVTNHTYETWSQAAITLSTSKAAFGGLKDKIPQMEGRRVTLEHYACRERGERPIQPCRTEGQEGGEAKGIWYWYCQRARRAACNDVHDR